MISMEDLFDENGIPILPLLDCLAFYVNEHEYVNIAMADDRKANSVQFARNTLLEVKASGYYL